MAEHQKHQEEAEEHYEECPTPQAERDSCSGCEAIDAEDAAYRTEPHDMFAREWGCF